MWEVIVVILVVISIGLGFALWGYKSLQPTRIGWVAHIYTTSSNKAQDLTEADLIPYGVDYIIKKQVDINVYKYISQRLNIETIPITPDLVKTFGSNSYVELLYFNNRLLALKPKLHINNNLIKRMDAIDLDAFTFSSLQKNNRLRRLEEKQNPFQAIMQWLAIVMFVIGIIAVSYIVVNGLISVSTTMKESIIELKSVFEEVKIDAKIQEEVKKQLNTNQRPTTTIPVSNEVIQQVG
jgi:hypothetical protein